MTRLETAQANLPAAPVSTATAEDSDLLARHEQLKAAAAEALAGIDSLLAKAG